MKKIALLLAIVAALFLAACESGEAQQTQSQTEGQTEPVETKEILVTVVHSDGTEEDFIYETTHEFLAPALVEEGLVELEDRGSGMEVIVADGEKLEAGTAWIAYESEYLIEQPLDSTRIMDGTAYKLVYTYFGY